MPKCPNCDANINLPDGSIANELINCPECSAMLEVMGEQAAEQELKLAPEVAEDWGQ